ncbi:hypothetical protein [Streptomyces sp. NBC_01803]|nr:hypothetical protein [Streptomyces sp. NBC_01803]WSA44373.1 hypothetical protein OIE51_09245 [Streptomyces sp. NBC_01803]
MTRRDGEREATAGVVDAWSAAGATRMENELDEHADESESITA